MSKRMKFADRMALIACEPDACWPWPLSRREGYGRVRIEGKMVQAHRAAYELLVGPIPSGLQIDHLCRNRACVNPSHMEPVTQQVNILRGVGPAAVNAVKTECIQGHPFNAENVFVDPKGGRGCRTCERERMAERRQTPERKAYMTEYNIKYHQSPVYKAYQARYKAELRRRTQQQGKHVPLTEYDL